MRSIELFSGAGGLALGLERAGFETVGFVERDAKACDTLRRNRPAWNIIEGDVQAIRFTDFGPIDLVAGGPPCQPFSIGGKGKGHRDHRDMFPEAVRAVRELAPLAFVFENVRGLLRPQFSNYVEYIRLQLTYPDFPVSGNVEWTTNLQRLSRHHSSSRPRPSLTYQVTVNQANAADFGVPQHRHRVFFVGLRSDINARWFFPTPTHSGEQLLHDKFVTGDYWHRHGLEPQSYSDGGRTYQPIPPVEALLPLTQPWLTVRDALSGLDDPRKPSDFRNHRFQPGAKSYPGHTGSPIDEPAKALKAGDHGVPGGENMLRNPNGKVRYFTVRESARLQTFPDDYEFFGSWTENMRQLGNAVPVQLACVVARSVASRIQPHASRSALQPT